MAIGNWSIFVRSSSGDDHPLRYGNNWPAHLWVLSATGSAELQMSVAKAVHWAGCTSTSELVLIWCYHVLPVSNGSVANLEKTMVFPFLSPNLLIILSMKLYNFGGRLIPNGSIGYLQDSRRSPVYADRLHARLAVSEVKISFGNSLDGTTHSRILMVHDPLSMLGCWKAEVTRGTVNIVYICLFIYEMEWNGYIKWVSNDEHIMTNHTPSLRALQFRRSPVHAPCQWTTLRARESLADSSTGESSACAALRNAKRNILRHRKKP